MLTRFQNFKTFKNPKTFWGVFAVSVCVILLFYSCVLIFLNPEGVQSSAGTDYIWVDGINGNDANECKTALSSPPANPFVGACRTIRRGINLIDGGGDVVKIRGTDQNGRQIVYYETISTDKNISGTATYPTIFEGYYTLYRPKIISQATPVVAYGIRGMYTESAQLYLYKEGNTSLIDSISPGYLADPSLVIERNTNFPIISYIKDDETAGIRHLRVQAGKDRTTIESSSALYDNDAVLGYDGNPAISFAGIGGLKVTRRDSSGTWVVSSALPYSLGWGTSITIGQDSFPLITDVHGVVHDCNDPNCDGGGETWEVFDSTAANLGSPIVLGKDGNPIVAYIAYTGTDPVLKTATRTPGSTNGQCGTATNWSCYTLDTGIGGLGGERVAMTMGTDGLPVIAYNNSDDKALKLAHCRDTACSTGADITTVESKPGDLSFIGSYPDITIGLNGNPLVSYDVFWYDSGYKYQIKLATCNNSTCTSRTGAVIASGANTFIKGTSITTSKTTRDCAKNSPGLKFLPSTSLSNIEFRYLEFEDIQGNAIHLETTTADTNISNITLDEVKVSNSCANGIYISASGSGSDITNITLKGGNIQNSTNSGIYISANDRVENLKSERSSSYNDVSLSNNQQGLFVSGNIITNSLNIQYTKAFSNTNEGILFQAKDGGISSNVFGFGTAANSNGSDGIKFETTGTGKITGNTISILAIQNNGGNGIYFNAASDIESNIISSNSFSSNSNDAIKINSSSNIQNNNTISQNTIDTTTTGSGINLTAPNLISSNIFSSNTIQNTQGWGISLIASNLISSNIFSSNTIQNTKESAICLGATYIQQNNFSKNTLSSSINSQGLNLLAFNSISSNLIDSNKIENNKSHGIYLHPALNRVTISSNYIINNQINNNQDDGINLTARDPVGDTYYFNYNYISHNLIQSNTNDGVEIYIPTGSSLKEFKDNTITDNIISNHNSAGSYGILINKDLVSVNGLINTRIFHNTLDSNNAGGIKLMGSSLSQGNTIRNNIISNSQNSISTNIGQSTYLTSDYNFFYNNTNDPLTWVHIPNESHSIGVVALFPDSPEAYDPGYYDYYIQSYPEIDLIHMPLANGAGSGNDKILGTPDDAKTLNENGLGIVNMGARKSLVINQKSTPEDGTDDFISNSIQQSHDDIHLSGADVLNAYSISEASFEANDSATSNPRLFNLNLFGLNITQNGQFVGNYVVPVYQYGSGGVKNPHPQAGEPFLIVASDEGGDTITVFAPGSFTLTSFGSGYFILDRIYTEDLKKSELPSRQFDLSKKGNPGWPVTWQSKTWDKSSATSTDWDWSADPVNTLDAQNNLTNNLYALAELKCVSFRDFSFINATSTSPFGGDPPDNSDCVQPDPENPQNLTCSEISWSCIPYSYLELNSKTYDTGVHGGAAYNSILWFGSPPPGLPEYDSNSHAKYLKMQLAASGCPNGYSGSKDDPVVYEENCQDMTQDYWGEDPTENGSPFYGDDTNEGTNCAESSYYYPDPDKITPIKGQCFNNLYNKRYFKYKLILNYYDLDKNGYPSEGDTTAKIDEVIINYSP